MKILSLNKLLFLILLISTNYANAASIMDFLNTGSYSSDALNVFLIITVLSLAPSILIMMTSFVRIIIVLAMVRTALGLQQSPPNQVMVSLAIFLTFFIMSPVFENAYYNGIVPLSQNKLTTEEAFSAAIEPFKKFMIANTREKDLNLFASIAKIDEQEKIENFPTRVIIPAFMISELRRGFEIGFMIFLPFIIIDIVVSSILMSMGMMMMPPVMIAMPFKIIFFVIIDGWSLLVGSLIKSFTT